MVETDSATQIFTKEEVSAARQLYKKKRDEKRAWIEDNEKRKLANQATRTLVSQNTSFFLPYSVTNHHISFGTKQT